MAQNNITAALSNIRNTIRQKEFVSFVIHFWQALPNLGPDGLRFPQIPSEVIPSRELLPLVEIQRTHLDSRLDPRTNKYVPKPIAYGQSIEHSYIDLYRRYGQYGITRISALDCDLSQAERLMLVFEQATECVKREPLERLAEFFEASTAVGEQLDAGFRPLKARFSTELDKLLSAGQVTPTEYHMMLSAQNQIAQAVVSAQLKALSPTEGRLPKSILDMNSGHKVNFDQLDNWIIGQFPSYNYTSRVSSRKNDDQMERLANILAGRLGESAPPREPAPPVVVTDVEPATAKTVPAPSQANVQCEGITKSNARCRREASPGSTFCPAHQDQNPGALIMD